MATEEQKKCACDDERGINRDVGVGVGIGKLGLICLGCGVRLDEAEHSWSSRLPHAGSFGSCSAPTRGLTLALVVSATATMIIAVLAAM